MATDTGSKPQFFQVATLPDVQILSTVPELKARLVAGDRLLAMFGNAEPNASLPLHSHPHEQITYVLEGAIHFQVGDAGHDLVPGEGLVIPGGVTHGGIRVGPEGCRFVEIFTPLRDEYVALMPKADKTHQGERPRATPAESAPEKVQTAAPLEHTPSPEDLYEPGGGNPSPGADIEDEAPPDRGGRTY